jgi:D-alanyl-D-alanine carboxypeptidase
MSRAGNSRGTVEKVARHRECIAVFALLMLSAPASEVAAQTAAVTDTAALRRALESTLVAIHSAAGFPGATAAVSLPDGPTVALAVGYADSALRVRMEPNDRMLVGSTGKTFFAAVAVQLASEGALDLDSPVSSYLGDRDWFSRVPNANSISVRNLMNHTSGVMRYEFKPAFVEELSANPDRRWEPAELVAYVLDERPGFAAGEGWDYSDTNYLLLGMILEGITGRDLYGEVERRLLVPLGLLNTVPSDSREIPGLVQGYAGAGNPFTRTDEVVGDDGRFVINPQFEWAGGGFASTTTDLARWAAALYGGAVLEAGWMGPMLDGVPARLGPDTHYGLGVIIRETPLGTAVGHSGFFPGYLTEMAYFVDHRIAVAVQVNTSVPHSLGTPLGAMAEELAKVVIDRLGG